MNGESMEEKTFYLTAKHSEAARYTFLPQQIEAVIDNGTVGALTAAPCQIFFAGEKILVWHSPEEILYWLQENGREFYCKTAADYEDEYQAHIPVGVVCEWWPKVAAPAVTETAPKPEQSQAEAAAPAAAPAETEPYHSGC
jgi:hypothetical protein